jgi:predicted RNA binding protein with dsRBD fold (UPF0201 family)
MKNIFAPVWMTDDKNKIHKAISSISKVSDLQKLKVAALNAPLPKVRNIAVEMIEDVNILIELAMNQSLVDVRRQAVVKLTAFEDDESKAIVANIAKNDTNPVIRKEVIRNLIDRTVLVEIAETETEEDILLLIIEMLAESKTSVAIGAIAVHNTLAHIAVNHNDCEIRYKAARKLGNKALAQEVYIDIVKSDNISDSRRLKIVERLHEQSALAYVAKLPTTLSKKIWAVRDLALLKITDKSILADIAENAEEEVLREAAYKRLAYINGLA